MTAPKALAGFYGSKKREQVICTPPYLLEPISRAMGGIALDAAGCMGSPASLLAERVYYEGDNGLIKPWADRTFCNPPYADLADWLEKASSEAPAGYQIAVLCPVRTKTLYWWRYADTADAIAWLKPVKFLGFEGTFPESCCLLYWGRRKLQFQFQLSAFSTKVQ